MASECPIFNKAAECLAAFNTCIESTTTPWPQDQLDRFNLWTAHGGIFEDYQERTSMDWRLRDRPELVEMMLQFLNLLRDYLSGICNIVGAAGRLKATDGKNSMVIQNWRDQPKPLPSNMSSTSSTSSSACSIGLAPRPKSVITEPVDTLQKNVEQTIGKLFRLSAVIRSAGISYRYTKAANFVEWENEVNLTQKFRDGVELVFKHKQPSPCKYMVKRLVESICLRQRELAYSQRNKRGQSERATGKKPIKSQGVTSLPPQSVSAYMQQGGNVSTTSKFNRTTILRKREGAQNHVQSTLYTATYVPTEVISWINPVVPRAIPRKFSTIDDALSNLPPPPVILQKPELKCPYCAIPIERAKFEGSAWRNHVLEDLRPYICVLPDCKIPHSLYKDSTSWINHMKTDHKLTKWKCAALSHENLEIFDTESQFLTHTASAHKGAFTVDEMPELANLARFDVLRELDIGIWPECPLCIVSFEDHDFMGVCCHIAEDLVEYAKLSIDSPYPAANQSQQASSSDQRVGYHRVGQRRESEVATEKTLPWCDFAQTIDLICQ